MAVRHPALLELNMLPAFRAAEKLKRDGNLKTLVSANPELSGAYRHLPTTPLTNH